MGLVLVQSSPVVAKALTLPDLQNAIITRLRSWRNQDAGPPAPSYNWPGVNDIVLDQDAVGWRAFLEGGVLHAWAAKQQEYYNWIKRRNTGKRWITILIKNYGRSPGICGSNATEK